MKKFIVRILGVGGLLLGAVLVAVRATEPAAPQSPRTGRVLVLENEATLTGQIERVGEQYRIRRLVGETWLPAEQVLRLCATIEEAYGFLRGRANLDDPDERLRLAEWCRQHGLRDDAVNETRAAAALKPNDEWIARQLRSLEASQALAQKPVPPPAPVKELPRVDLTAEEMGAFTARVQPILMNACANCHVAGRGGNFQLTRVTGPALGNRRALEQNLAAVLAQVNPQQPQLSRLLLKATTIHAPGMTQSPLRNRQSPAYQTIEKWVLTTLANNPQLHEANLPSATASALALPSAPRPDVAWGQDRALPPPVPTAPAPAVAAPAVPVRSVVATPPPATDPAVPAKPAPPPADGKGAAPVAKPRADDPVDPEAFNREYHPSGKAPTGS